MQYHPLLSSPSFDSPFSSCFSWLGPRNSPSPLRPPHCALSHSHPQSLLSQTSRFATSTSSFAPQQRGRVPDLTPCLLPFLRPKRGFFLFLSKMMSPNPLSTIPSVLLFASSSFFNFYLELKQLSSSFTPDRRPFPSRLF